MALVITTTSCSSKAEYFANINTCLYPGFKDGREYLSYENDTSQSTGEKDYFQLRATGGTTYSWALLSGSLPDGLSLGKDTPTDGKIYGTPTKVGVFTFTVQVSSPGETPVTKELTLMVDEWRAKWLRDARTIIVNNWGKMSGPQPPIDNTSDGVTVDTHIDEFEAEVTDFDANAYVDQLDAWGIDVMEFSAKNQNHSLLYPSTYATRYNDHSDRDFLGEVIDAFHANSKKIIGYFAADSFYYGAPPQILCDGAIGTGNFAGPNDAHIREMLDKGIDGFVFDIGAARELEDFFGVNPGWLNRDAMIAAVRKKNPWCIFGINPGVRNQGFRAGGSLIAYPDCDFVVFESVKSNSTSEQLLELATPPYAKKKLAVYVWQQITNSFAFGVGTIGAPIKEIEGIKRNMSKNWNADGTFAAALPVKRNGKFLDPYFEDTFNEIGAHHSANKDFSDDVDFSYSGGLLTISTPNKSKIFYTLDGSEPTEGSEIYMQPIPISWNTMVRARSLQRDKSIGYISNYIIEDFDIPESKRLFKAVLNDVNTTDARGDYKGFLITVGRAPIELLAVGRKVVGSVTQDHQVIIRRKPDEYAIYRGAIKSDGEVENGYVYSPTAAVRLEAGMSYIIACQEGTVDQFASNTFGSIPRNPDLKISGIFTLNSFGDLFPTYAYNTGQFLNLKYRVIKEEESKDLALGKYNNAFIDSVTGGTLGPSATVYFANNATNGDDVSFAVAGGVLAYTLRVDLGEPQEISRVKIKFGSGYSTNFELHKTMNGSISALKLLRSVDGNSDRDIELTFPRTTARYLHLKSLKPSISGEPGGSMQVVKFQVYK